MQVFCQFRGFHPPQHLSCTDAVYEFTEILRRAAREGGKREKAILRMAKKSRLL